MKGFDPHALGIFAEQVAHSLAHFGSGLVREGNGQNLARPCLFVGEQMGDAVGKNPGLARAGTSHNQQRRAAVFNRRTLLRVEPLEQLRAVVWGCEEFEFRHN